jgi:hypothetical protein
LSKKYTGAYRDKKDRIRPITPRKRSSAKTGVPVRKRNSSKKVKKEKNKYIIDSQGRVVDRYVGEGKGIVNPGRPVLIGSWTVEYLKKDYSVHETGRHLTVGKSKVKVKKKADAPSPVVTDIRKLSGGTISTLTGSTKYEDIDREREGFARWTEGQIKKGRKFDSWQDAWKAFQPDKSTVIYAKDRAEAIKKVEAKFGEVKTAEKLGVDHLGNPYFRVTFYPKEREYAQHQFRVWFTDAKTGFEVSDIVTAHGKPEAERKAKKKILETSPGMDLIHRVTFDVTEERRPQRPEIDFTKKFKGYGKDRMYVPAESYSDAIGKFSDFYANRDVDFYDVKFDGYNARGEQMWSVKTRSKESRSAWRGPYRTERTDLQNPVKSRRLSRGDKIKALMSEFGYTRKEADIFLKDMGE